MQRGVGEGDVMETKRILIIEDEARMRKLLKDYLAREGYEIIESGDGKSGLEFFLEQETVDLVILDIMLPGFDGWTVCREIRKVSDVPIIILTARSEESDELFGFELGADEYITKPFSPKILVARVKSLFRRLQRKDEPIKSYEGLEIDTARHYVFNDGDVIDLSPKEFELLSYLAENEGKALKREQILNSVWGYDYFGDLRTVDTHVQRLRIKLGDKSRLIQTVRGVGYRFEVSK